jgi:hypothetical protein
VCVCVCGGGGVGGGFGDGRGWGGSRGMFSLFLLIQGRVIFIDSVTPSFSPLHTTSYLHLHMMIFTK